MREGAKQGLPTDGLVDLNVLVCHPAACSVCLLSATQNTSRAPVCFAADYCVPYEIAVFLVALFVLMVVNMTVRVLFCCLPCMLCELACDCFECLFCDQMGCICLPCYAFLCLLLPCFQSRRRYRSSPVVLADNRGHGTYAVAPRTHFFPPAERVNTVPQGALDPQWPQHQTLSL